MATVSGKRALVLGGTTHLGKAVVRELLAAGALAQLLDQRAVDGGVNREGGGARIDRRSQLPHGPA